MLWRRICHLWTTYGMGGLRSLDWPAIQSKIGLIESRSDMRYPLDVIEGLEVMEAVVLSELRDGKKG